MKAELAARLLPTTKGASIPKSGVTGVTGVAGVPATCSKSLKLHRLRPLRLKNDKLANNVSEGVVEPVAAVVAPHEAEIEERKGLAMGNVPESYLDAWARLQVQRPFRVDEARWRQTIDDGGRFLDRWGNLASEFGWMPGNLFDVPGDGKTGGLVWWLEGAAVRSLGLEHAIAAGGRVFDRTRS